MIDIRLLAPHEASVLERVAEEVFDLPVNAALDSVMLADPRLRLAVALAGGGNAGKDSWWGWPPPSNRSTRTSRRRACGFGEAEVICCCRKDLSATHQTASE